MTAYDYIRFPAFKLPSGRWMKIDMGTQGISPHPVAPYAGTPVDMTVNPWAWEGIPEPEDSCAPDEGSFGIDSADIVFHNVAVKPLVDDTTLEEILSSTKSEVEVWNLRIWTTTTVTLGVPVFASAPDRWYIVESSEASGDIRLADKTWNTYKLTLVNPLKLLEGVTPALWLDGRTPAGGSISPLFDPATYDVIPASGVFIDGHRLAGLYYSDGKNASGEALGITGLPLVSASAPLHELGPDAVRLVRLTDLLYTIGTCIGITRPINNSGSGSGAVGSTWEYPDIDLTALGHPETTHDFDDLCMWHDRMKWNVDVPGYVRDKKWTLFDAEKLTPISAYNHGNLLAVVKKLLIPHGLTCRVAWGYVAPNIVQYLEVREVELSSLTTGATSDVLQGITQEQGEAAAYGFTVVTANNGELVEGDGGSKSIDNMYMSATRLRDNDRWTYGAGNTGNVGDMECTSASLYAYDAGAGKALSVYKVIPKRDGVERVTPSEAMSSPPGCAPTTITGSWEAQANWDGATIAKAAMAYYWNGLADPETDPVGVWRRYTKKLKWRETGIKSILVGSMRGMLGRVWTVRKVKHSYHGDWTEIEAERGTYNA